MWQIFNETQQVKIDGILSTFRMVNTCFTPKDVIFENIYDVLQYAQSNGMEVLRFNSYNNDIDLDYDVELCVFEQDGIKDGINQLCAIAVHDGMGDVRSGYSKFQLCTTDKIYANGYRSTPHHVIKDGKYEKTVTIYHGPQPFFRAMYRFG